MPSIKQIAFGDLDREIAVSRRVLERLPEDKFDWKVHEKSMSAGSLAMHVAGLLQWMIDTMESDELDLETVKPPRTKADGRDDLLKTFDDNAAAVKAAMAKMDDAALTKEWTLRRGDQVMYRNSRATILRVWCLSHLIHHRAQLAVYLRLLNVPVPAIYFNSSDEPEWIFD